MEPVEPAKVQKEGFLGKLGGSAGGHKNWKDRYFVLSDHLYYYDNKAAYEKNPKAPTGRVVLAAYYCSRTEDSASFEFIVNAYPKSLTLRAHSAAEMEEWMAAIMAPLKELSTPPALAPEVEKALAALKSKELALGGAAAGGAGAGK